MEIDLNLIRVGKPWHILNDKTGEVENSGMKVILSSMKQEITPDYNGFTIYTGNIPTEHFDNLKTKELPLKVKAIFTITSDSKLKLIDIKY
ncbi:MAG: hypothetical protein IJB82_02370 [Bacilli bacterium]|nr:hypothetical protein [Bacilli bacterium]